MIFDEIVEFAANAEVLDQSDIFLRFLILAIVQFLYFYDTFVNGALDKRKIVIIISCRI